MTERVRVGLLFGGRSVEHEVSIVSARGVASAMSATALECVPIAVTGDGRWLGSAESASILASSGVRVDDWPGIHGAPGLAVEPGTTSLIEFDKKTLGIRRLDLDVMFPLVHGWGGEDGRVQGALDLAGIPYVGASLLGSALAMDKVVAKRMFAAAGLPVVRGLVFERSTLGTAGERIEDQLGFPVFVKPANGGSSVGVSRVSSLEGLPSALEAALACDRHALVEAAVDAREIECAVLGNDQPRASVLGEIHPSREFYDYDAKYVDGTSGLDIPAKLEASQAEQIRRLAVAAYRALDLSGFARVDCFVDRRTGQPYLNEINTLPGFTPISMFPKLWEMTGLQFPQLLETLVGLALERAGEEGRRRVRLVP